MILPAVRECVLGTPTRIVQNHISSACIVAYFLADVKIKLEDFVSVCFRLLH